MPFDQPEITEPIQGVESVEYRNWIDDEDVVKKIKADILPLLKKARTNRNAKLTDDWDRYRDVYNLRRTVSFYDGRSKLFLGALRKAVDTLTRIAKDSMLADPYVSVETDVEKWRDTGVHFVKYLLENQAGLRLKMSMFLRQLYQIGTSCFRFGWKTSYRTVRYRSKGEGGNAEIKTRKAYDHYGPTLDVIDMRHVYVWPENAVDYDNLKLVFEDSVISVNDLRAKVKKGWYDTAVADKAIQARSTSIEQDNRARSQNTKEGVIQIELEQSELDITEAWVRFELPVVEGEEEDDDSNCIPWVWITISGEEILRIQENPWWFGHPPYLFGAIFREHDYFYGHGLIEAGEMWQYMLNDTVNQTMDCGTYSLNPIAIMDPAAVDDPDMYQIEPMAKWLLPPDSVRFERPPGNMTQEGLGIVRFLLNIIQETSDATALMQGAPREGLGKATGTATGVSQLFASSSAAVVDQVEELEPQVFTPLLKMTEIAAHQFMDDKMVIRLEGPDAVVLTQRIIEPSDLVLSTDIRWIASRRLREKLAKGQQYLNMLNIALGVDPQITLQQGFVIDLKYLLKGAAIAIGADDADKIIKDVTQTLPGVPAELEYELVLSGRSVFASPLEPVESHMQKIQILMALPMPETEFAQIKLKELIASHMAVANQIQMQMMQAAQGGGGTPGGTARGPVGGPPVRPQEQPIAENVGEAVKGIMSQIGGA
ncbi:MAG: hypothetical protein WC773_04525 [Patescibacteria group bacterium]|jgi:hypothetical protein